jgi:hypothetical protein
LEKFNKYKVLQKYGQFGSHWLWEAAERLKAERTAGVGVSNPLPENIMTMESGEPLITEDGAYLTVEAPEHAGVEEIAGRLSSESWTGIAARLQRDPQTVERIKQSLGQLDADVETLTLSNHERAKVKAMTEALVKLIESPEPEWRVIVDLLRSPTLGAILGLAGVVQLALKLIFGVG